MKSLTFFAAFATLFSVFTNANADEIDKLTENKVSVHLNGIEVMDDSIRVNMLMRTEGHHSKCIAGVRYTPYLHSDENDRNVYLPSVIIAGTTAFKSYRRSAEIGLPYDNNAKFSPYRIIRDRSESRTSYSVCIKKEDWMDGASLCLLIDEIGCGMNKRNDIRMLANAITVKPAPSAPVLLDLHFDYAIPPREIEKTRSVSETEYLDYIVNKTYIAPNYMDNQSKLDRISRIFDEVTGQEGVTVKEVGIEGYASPEGTLAWNRQLSEGRAKSLCNYLKGRYSTLKDMDFNLYFGGENWDDLVVLLKESDHVWKDEALDIIYNNEIVKGREKKLMDLRGGDPYRYMLKEYFPYLRKSIVSIQYTVRSFDLEEAKRVMETAPQNLSLAEMHMVASSYEPRSAEFRRTLETAALYFPEDEYLNLNLAILALESKDLVTAGIRLSASKAFDTAEYYNAMGAYEYMRPGGDISKSYEYFKQAALMGSTAARLNVEKLEKVK